MVKICTYFIIAMSLLLAGCNVDNTIQGDSGFASTENILDKFSLNVESVNSTGFSLKVNSTSADISKNKILKLYYCNQVVELLHSEKMEQQELMVVPVGMQKKQLQPLRAHSLMLILVAAVAAAHVWGILLKPAQDALNTIPLDLLDPGAEA
ncbi:MAG: hypothetical protein HOO06_09065 [Bdellovibrionaceae bacterium]|jgi:hypothetical protein|nr:hypothetical protein [Pseudobdellovibrionaceae bacterium]